MNRNVIIVEPVSFESCVDFELNGCIGAESVKVLLNLALSSIRFSDFTLFKNLSCKDLSASTDEELNTIVTRRNRMIKQYLKNLHRLTILFRFLFGSEINTQKENRNEYY